MSLGILDADLVADISEDVIAHNGAGYDLIDMQSAKYKLLAPVAG